MPKRGAASDGRRSDHRGSRDYVAGGLVSSPADHDAVFAQHLQRVKAQTVSSYSLAMIADWVSEHTFLRGEPYNYHNHEFQEYILRDKSREKYVRKCSQIGLSELSIRWTVAVLHVLPSSTIIYTLPTATFAKSFVKTRVDPLIQTSPTLSNSVSSTADNSEIKRFNDSFLYIKGTVGQNAAISVPADGIVNDEVDFSDPGVMSTYHSRLTHSRWKLRLRLSTPTVAKYGISADFDASRRHWNFVKCSRCGFFFLPDYFEHVKIPGFTGDLREINQDNLHKYRVPEAHLACPSCGGAPDLSPAHREWVIENPDDTYEAAGFQIQPFDAPQVISCADLVISSTKYRRYVDFINFNLGLPAEDKDTTLTKADVDACYVRGEKPGFTTHVMGLDMGLMCHAMVAGVDSDGRLVVVHTEVIPVSRVRERKVELARQYRVSITVMDTQPYVETVLALQDQDPNLYGSIFVTSKGIEAYTLKQKEKDADEGQLDIRQLNVNRNRALDVIMDFVRSGNLVFVEDGNRDTVTAHLQDMKRIKNFTSDDEISFTWQKSSKGDDHFHFALLYTWLAMQLRGVSRGMIMIPSYVGSFKVKTPI